MARRQRTVQLDSADVQGDDSFVEFKKYTVGERRDLQKRFKDVEQDETFDLVQTELLSRIVEWNWADDDGELLVVPDSIEGFDDLVDDELGFLVDAILAIVTGENLKDMRKN